MGTRASRPVLPATGRGWAGAVVALVGLAVLVALMVVDALRVGPDERPGFWIAWVAITAGALLLLGALARGERALLALLALVPFALFVVLVLMELTGLME